MSPHSGRVWVQDPHTGGTKIPERTKLVVVERFQALFAKLGHHKTHRLEVRFRGALCYIDAYQNPDPGPDASLIEHWKRTGMDVQVAMKDFKPFPTHLGRLRHFDLDRWSYAFYAYSSERYEPSVFGDGSWYGTPEQALEIGCIYLHG